jgi:GMP synthase-like glutamine amidotransferase
MTTLLVVQSRITEARIERERGNYRRAVGKLARVDFLSSVDEKLAWKSPESMLKGYDGVIFGGSSDFDFHGGRPSADPARLMSLIIMARAKNIVMHAVEKRIPILGVCFGHQIIGNIYGGMVGNDVEQKKHGAYEVMLTEAGKTDPLFSAMPPAFFAQYAHKDSVTNLPEGATLLATGGACKYSALRYGDRIHTVQFHPEVRQMPRGPQQESPESSKLIQQWIERIVRA